VEIFLDETLIATLGSNNGLEKENFAACLPIPYVTPGEHQFRARWRGQKNDPERLAPDFSVPVTVFDAVHDGVISVRNASVAVALPRREARPRVSLDGVRCTAAEWFCVRRAEGFLGVAAVDTAALLPGPHDLALILSDRTLRRRLLRLDVSA
jgi:hypothetical protein